MSKKKNIWKILGMAGMIFGFLGTMMQGYAEDKDDRQRRGGQPIWRKKDAFGSSD